MKVRQVFALLAIALAGNVAMAADPVPAKDDMSSMASRAEVRAERVQAPQELPPMSGGEAAAFVDRPVA
jgi:hypothetical protein